jgi:hypothetical protein
VLSVLVTPVVLDARVQVLVALALNTHNWGTTSSSGGAILIFELLLVVHLELGDARVRITSV